MALARRVRVSGRVQGVFFRAWTRQQAQSLGVSGWVRNCDDGSVEAHIEGDDEAVERLVERLGQGPEHARVDDIQSRETELRGQSDFAIVE